MDQDHGNQATKEDGPRTGDGFPFVLGMTLYKLNSDETEILEYPTSETTHRIETFWYEGKLRHCLTRRGWLGMDLLSYSSTRRGAVSGAIGEHRRQIAEHERAIEDLELLANQEG